MTYKEAYMQLNTKEEIMKMANDDMATALILNPDRISAIRKVAEEVINEKFGSEIIKLN